ncbi:MAG TPA: hypothetical protein VMG13_25755 [Trebonia sp.]|nr:hypothetical protein [Trebonia sp.]
MTSFLPAAVQPAARELTMTPARRIILLLGVPVSLSLLAWTCFAIISKSSQGNYQVSYAPVHISGGLAMNVYGGDVTLQGGVAPSAAQFTGTGTVWYGLTYSGQRPTLSTAQTATGTKINFTCADYNCALNSAVGVPPKVPVTVTSNGGDITATGLSNATLQTNGGDITATGLSNATLQTGGGNLTVDGLTGNVSLNTDSTPNSPNGAGGDISGTLAAQNATVDSGGNNVDLQLTAPPSNLNITTEGGNVTLQLPGGYSYDVDNIPSPTNDSVGPDNPAAITVPTSAKSPYRVTVNTDGGNVTID